jgi:hypothetical protein
VCVCVCVNCMGVGHCGLVINMHDPGPAPSPREDECWPVLDDVLHIVRCVRPARVAARHNAVLQLIRVFDSFFVCYCRDQPDYCASLRLFIASDHPKTIDNEHDLFSFLRSLHLIHSSFSFDLDNRTGDNRYSTINGHDSNTNNIVVSLSLLGGFSSDDIDRFGRQWSLSISHRNNLILLIRRVLLQCFSSSIPTSGVVRRHGRYRR